MTKKIPPFLDAYDKDLEGHMSQAGAPIASPSYFANLLAQVMRLEWRYEPFLKQWFHFNGLHWAESESALSAVNKHVINTMQLERPFIQKADTVFGSTFVPATKKLLESNPLIQIRLQDLNLQYELLNTPTGTINLADGSLVPADPEHLMTQITKVSPLDDDNGANCPHYIQHLNFISQNNQDLRHYFELFSGYALTGHTFLQEFYTWTGFGCNGKSILFRIWQHILGDYAGVANSGQFSQAGRTAHREQDLRLAGRRLIACEEVSNWDLDKLKQFTDGGVIMAREMHGKTTGFSPQCKLLFLTNNPPKLDNLDFGVQRRLKIIDFKQRIGDTMRNPRFLEECLIPEAPYIFNRMVKHAQEFLECRELKTPEVVIESSREFFDSENVLQQFRDDHIKDDANGIIGFGDFYTKLSVWCAKQGYPLPSTHKAGRQLVQWGYQRNRHKGRSYEGLAWLDTSPSTYITNYTPYYGEEGLG